MRERGENACRTAEKRDSWGVAEGERENLTSGLGGFYNREGDAGSVDYLRISSESATCDGDPGGA